MLQRFHWLPVLLVFTGLVASVIALAKRYEAAAGSRAVALVLDYGQLRTLITTTGVPADEAYRRFKAAGITGVALTEETLADLVSEGAAEVTAGSTREGAREYRIAIGDPQMAARVAEYVPRLV